MNWEEHYGKNNQDELEDSQYKKRNPAYKVLAGMVLLAFIIFSFPQIILLVNGSLDFLKNRANLQDNAALSRAVAAVVSVEAYADDALNTGSRSGTGFNLSSTGLIITNRHIVENARSIKIEFEEGQVFYPSNINYIENADLVWIELEAEGLPYVLAYQGAVPVLAGDIVSVIGNPKGFHKIILQGPLVGHYNARDIPVMLLDIDCQPGNSGSPVLSSEGEVLGVVYAVTSGSEEHNSSNHTLAYPMDYFREYLPLPGSREFN